MIDKRQSHIKLPLVPSHLLASILRPQQRLLIVTRGNVQCHKAANPVSCQALDLAVFSGFSTTFKEVYEAKLIKQK